MRGIAVSLTGALALVPAALPAPAEEVPQDLVQEARALAKAFFTELEGELERAIAEKGAAGAIGVCGEKAPGIAGKLSEKAGRAVGRTALRMRNPRNAPSPLERAVLVRFRERIAAGEDPAKVEWGGMVEEGGMRHLHDMKAIPTGQVCLTCHGSEVEPEVLRAIRAGYPADAATGFREGELRGAFTFVRPLDRAGRHPSRRSGRPPPIRYIVHTPCPIPRGTGISRDRERRGGGTGPSERRRTAEGQAGGAPRSEDDGRGPADSVHRSHPRPIPRDTGISRIRHGCGMRGGRGPRPVRARGAATGEPDDSVHRSRAAAGRARCGCGIRVATRRHRRTRPAPAPGLCGPPGGHPDSVHRSHPLSAPASGIRYIVHAGRPRPGPDGRFGTSFTSDGRRRGAESFTGAGHPLPRDSVHRSRRLGTSFTPDSVHRSRQTRYIVHANGPQVVGSPRKSGPSNYESNGI